ncbi:hypothetical protein CR920_08645 [Stenotrophomonas indicatrix]|nr:hypothetical protein CR920_08645 [Stenotrophomonas indicatrix]
MPVILNPITQLQRKDFLKLAGDDRVFDFEIFVDEWMALALLLDVFDHATSRALFVIGRIEIRRNSVPYEFSYAVEESLKGWAWSISPW